MAQFSQFPIISKKYQSALATVAELHKFQMRKDATAYLPHLMMVSSLLMEMGCSEELAIAGLFHDSLEDLENPLEIAELIETQFGKYILYLVKGVTENKELPTEQRKLDYIKQIFDGPIEVVYISFSDKWHNWCHGYARQPKLVKKPVIEFYAKLIPIFQDRLCNSVGQFYLQELINSFESISKSVF
ncbi:HD domain-containing protein [Laspinema olomoucense]|uniref:HD domain-containing protein n=1 Tax=Laspinema olomoucense TaxID=3231600 RepID=UPI0021BA9507|nr:HD domain-containing protein [Laspinema sp. D3d]MCT7971210.1 HD domain-containing protein [Laspinema sp. D3d]